MVIKAEPCHIEQVVALDERVIGSRSREVIIRNAVKDGRCFVIPGDGVVAAYAIVNDNFFDRHFIELLIVKAESRRNGFGRSLMHYLTDLYCRGGGELFTSTNSSNAPMQKLLDVCGFICCGNIGRLDEGDPELIYCFEGRREFSHDAVTSGERQDDVGITNGETAGKATAGKATAEQATAEQATAGIGEMGITDGETAGQATAGQAPAGIGEMGLTDGATAGQATAGQATAEQATAGQATVGQAPAGIGEGGKSAAVRGIAGLNRFVHEIAEENYFSGAIHVSQKGGADDFHYENAFGYANKEWHISNSIVTRFNTASISKVFTACGILILAEQGALTLEDRLCDHISFDGEPFSRDITLYHLLTHSSGIADDADEEAGENYEDLFINKPNYRFRNASDLVENFIGKAPVFRPGEGCRYNNAGYVLLGMVIEKISGMEYKDWLRDNLLIPWGLTSTYFPSMDEINENTADGYLFVEDSREPSWRKNIYSFPPIGTPEGGIYTTVGDLDRLMRGLADGRFFNEQYTRLFMTPKVFHSSYGTIQHFMGFGFEFYMVDDRIRRMDKDGSNPGVSAVMSYYPETGTNIVILANTNCGVWKMHHQIENHLGI